MPLLRARPIKSDVLTDAVFIVESRGVALYGDDPSLFLSNAKADRLLDLDLRASFFELLLHAVGVGLVDAFLDGARHAFDQVLRFLQAEARQFADDLDDADLLVGRVFLEDDRELGLRFGRSRGSGGSGATGSQQPPERRR